MKIKTTLACCQIMGREERARTETERTIRAFEQFKRDYPLGILIDDSDKFTEETITKALEEWDRLEKLPRRPLILPGEGTKLPEAKPYPWPVLDEARGIKPGELVVLSWGTRGGKKTRMARDETRVEGSTLEVDRIVMHRGARGGKLT